MAAAVSLFLVLLFAFWIRLDAFWLPHWRGDQSQYVALAMKWKRAGLEDYSLRGVNLRTLSPVGEPSLSFSCCVPAPPGDPGDLIRGLRTMGHDHFDEPMHSRAPLFPAFLSLSHDLFLGEGEPYAVCTSNLGADVRSSRPPVIFKVQFWAAVVPVFFNLGVILATFFFGRRFFGTGTGLIAAFLMASNPVSVTLAYRLLVEDTLTFFTVVSFFLYLLGCEKKNRLLVAAAGAAAGLAILGRQTAVLIFPAVGIHAFAASRAEGKGWRSLAPSNFLIFTVFALLVSAAWFFKVWQVFGNPIHQPGSIEALMRTDKTGWFRDLAQKPSPYLYFSWEVIRLSPFFAFALLTLGKAWRPAISSFSSKPLPPSRELVLWCWILAHYVFLTEPWHVVTAQAVDEHRFFYPVYPAIALLAASAWQGLRARWAATKAARLGWDAAAASLLALNAWKAIPPVMKLIYGDSMLY